MNKPIASLSMYEWPETKEALDILWTLISQNLRSLGIEAPDDLTRSNDLHAIWNNDALLVGQTCGWPYANLLRGKTIPFARFDYGLTHAKAGDYYSVFIGQKKEDEKFLQDHAAFTQAQKVAINGGDSQSGFHVFGEILGSAAKDFIPQSMKLLTGSHRQSVKSVAKGDATIAAIDAVSFELSKRYDPCSTSKICELGKSKAVPGLPLITSVKNTKMIPKLFDSVVESVKALPDEQKQCLMIKGVVCAYDSEYDVFNSSKIR